MSIARSVMFNTSVQLVGKIISTALGIGIVALMTRQLGKEGFGMYSIANAYLQTFTLLLDLGLNVMLVALLGEHAGDVKYERRCTSSLFTLRITLALIVFGSSLLIAQFFPYNQTVQIAIVALVGSYFFAVLNQTVSGVQQKHFKTYATAAAEVLGRLVLFGGLLLAPILEFGLIEIVWIVTLGAIANFSLNFLVARRYASFTWNWDPEFWLMALKRSWPIGVSIAFNLIYYKADTLILSLVRTEAEVGIYSAAYRVLEILITVPFLYAGLVLPLLSQARAKQDKERFGMLINKSIQALSFLVFPMIAGTLVLGPKILTLVAGNEFAMSGHVLRILIFAVGAIYLNTMLSHAVVAMDAQKRMIPFYAAVAAIALAAYIVFIPVYGMWAAAWITVASEISIGFGSFSVMKKFTSVHIDRNALFSSVASSVIMGIIILFFQHLSLFLLIPLAGTLYFALLLLTGGVTIAILKQLIHQT